MIESTSSLIRPKSTETPPCSLFGQCGGCEYQDITYKNELLFKEAQLRELFTPLKLKPRVFKPIVASPKHYHYRTRLDVQLLRTKDNTTFMGFQPQGAFRVLEAENCAIARSEISNYLPLLKVEAIAKMPQDYRTANLVIKTSDDGKIRWGGIGRRSLELPESDYLFTKIGSKKIYHSLDTFFQANTFILPRVLKTIESIIKPNKKTVFLDLYSGVGLFGLLLARKVKHVHMIEEVSQSITLAHFNVKQMKLKNVTIHEGKVEDVLMPSIFCHSRESGNLKRDPRLKRSGMTQGNMVALVDPPRKGLSDTALKALVKAKNLKKLLYLSCGPESLLRDLLVFQKKGWEIKQIIPFDFFPRTKHIEVLVYLKKKI